MPPFYYALGEKGNLLERAYAVTMTPSDDALYPKANLYDSRPQRPARHGSNAANPEIRWDLAAFNPGTAASYTFTARAGERRYLTSGGTSNVQLKNPATGKYLQSGGASWGASANCLTGAGSLSYQVESFATCQVPTVQLQLTQSAAVTLSDWPRWNAVVIFGHNLDVGLTVELRSSTDNFATNNVLEVTGAILQPAFYMIDTAGIATRWGRILFTGTNQTAPWYAECYPCWLETSITGHVADGYEVKYLESQVRNDGRFGTVSVVNQTPQPRRVAKFVLRPSSATGESELRLEMMLRSRGGVYPMVMVPMTNEATVFYGRLTDQWLFRRLLTSVWETDITLAEEPIVAPLD